MLIAAELCETKVVYSMIQATSAIAANDGLELRLNGCDVVGLTAQCIGTFTSELIDDIGHISRVRRSRGCLARDAILADLEDRSCKDCRKACGQNGDERWSEGLHLKKLYGQVPEEQWIGSIPVLTLENRFVLLESGIGSVVLVVDCVECVLQSLRFDSSRTPFISNLTLRSSRRFPLLKKISQTQCWSIAS
jgi:hypothetical protein